MKLITVRMIRFQIPDISVLLNLSGLSYRVQSNCYCVAVSIQMLVGRHGLDRATQGTDTIGRDLLESDLLDETIQVYAAICLGITVGRQGMIRAGSIITSAFPEYMDP